MPFEDWDWTVRTSREIVLPKLSALGWMPGSFAQVEDLRDVKLGEAAKLLDMRGKIDAIWEAPDGALHGLMMRNQPGPFKTPTGGPYNTWSLRESEVIWLTEMLQRKDLIMPFYHVQAYFVERKEHPELLTLGVARIRFLVGALNETPNWTTNTDARATRFTSVPFSALPDGSGWVWP